MPPYTSKKRKYPFKFKSSRKSATGPSTRSEPHEVVADALRHGIRKGLMTSQGLVAPPPLLLLVKDKEYAMDIACSIVQDADLDECSEHETDPLGDSGLFDMIRVCCSTVVLSLLVFIRSLSITFVPFNYGLVRMRALQICCVAREASIKCLRNHLETESEFLKQFKETSLTLGQEMIELKVKCRHSILHT